MEGKKGKVFHWGGGGRNGSKPGRRGLALGWYMEPVFSKVSLKTHRLTTGPSGIPRCTSIWKNFTVSKPKKLADLENKIGHLFCAGTMRAKTGLAWDSETEGLCPERPLGHLEWTPLSEVSCPATSVAPISHLYLSPVLSRIEHFRETTGQEVREGWISSWELWFPQAKRCGGSHREALAELRGCRAALWAPSVCASKSCGVG